MKPLLTLLCLVFFLNSNAQKLVEDNKDEFTGSQIKKTSEEKLFRNISVYASVSFNKINDQYFLLLSLGNNFEVFSVDQGQEIYVKFEDDSVKTLHWQAFQISRDNSLPGFLWTGYYALRQSIPVTFDEVTLFARKRIVKCKILTSTGHYEKEVSNGADIQKIAELIMK